MSGSIGIDRRRKRVAKIRRLERRVGRARKALVDHRIAQELSSRTSRDATEATAAARSASSPSLAIVAEVPMQIGCVIRAEPVAHAAHEHRHVGALAAAVSVKLVEDEEVEPLRRSR